MGELSPLPFLLSPLLTIMGRRSLLFGPLRQFSGIRATSPQRTPLLPPPTTQTTTATMGDEAGEDFSQLPLADQFTHKNWKARKGGYEAASKAFDTAQSEDDAIVRQFISDSGIWKGVVSDSNVAAQQEGLGALCSFLNIAGKDGCTRHVTSQAL